MNGNEEILNTNMLHATKAEANHTPLGALLPFPREITPVTTLPAGGAGAVINYDNKHRQRDNSVAENVFEVPLLDSSDFCADYLNYFPKEIEERCFENDVSRDLCVVENYTENEGMNSDSTIEYSVEVGDDQPLQVASKPVEEKNCNITIPSPNELFSPLPSTSKDFNTININDMMFSKAVCVSPNHGISNYVDQQECPKQELNVDRIEEKHSIKKDKKVKPIEDLSVVECSSGSENGDDDVVISGETKPNIIDLSNEDAKSDSDCEIVDIDGILHENEKVLNNTRLPSPSRPRHNPSDSIEIISLHTEVKPMPLELERTDVEEVPLNQPYPAYNPPTPPPPPSNNFIPLFNDFKNFCDQYFRLQNLQNDNSEPIEHPFRTDQLPFYPYLNIDPANLESRRPKRSGHSSRKRRKIDSVIDLSVTSTVKPSSSSDVIVIDVDSPVSIQRTSNNGLAQISVSIVTPIPTSINPPPSEPVITPPSTSVPYLKSSITPPPSRLGDCPVCLENFSKLKAVSTFCGHLFCIACISTVKKTSNRCPTCRQQLKGKGYHPIFL